MGLADNREGKMKREDNMVPGQRIIQGELPKPKERILVGLVNSLLEPRTPDFWLDPPSTIGSDF